MEQQLEISAIDCFIGLVDPSAYPNFIREEVSYEMLEEHLLQQMQKGTILFWGSNTPNRWTVHLVEEASSAIAAQEFKGHLKVSDQGLYLVNYAMILDAAQYEEDPLTEQYLELIQLEQAWYQVTVRQLFHPEVDAITEESLGFEVVLQRLSKAPSSPANTFKSIPWSIY